MNTLQKTYHIDGNGGDSRRRKGSALVSDQPDVERPDTDQPNIVVIQADQLAPRALGAYGNPTVRSPYVDRLADEGVVFDRAYCNSPLCAPSRASMMTGLLPSQIGAYDNAAEFASSTPTVAHHLRTLGYHTALVGRMHFIGPDQLHGFEERQTSDVYPADMSMVPDWRLGSDQRLPWYHDSGSVFTAGVSAATVQRDFDDEVTFAARRYLTQRARDRGRQPFFLVASYIHPHDPYEPSAEHWARYDDVEIDPPATPTVALDELDPHSRRLQAMSEFDSHPPTAAQTLRARRAYYACVSYVDDQIGSLLDRMRELALLEDAVIIVISDHGDLLGERGMWYKMSPLEQSARVPLIVRSPERFRPGRVDTPVSLVDLLPTLVTLAGGDPPIDAAGSDLGPLLRGEPAEGRGDVIVEYLAEGTTAPQLTVVRGDLKYTWCPGDPDQLFDLSIDPLERTNLAESPEWQDTRAELRKALLAGRDLRALDRDVRTSQERRRLVARALATGRVTEWDHRPRDLSSELYVRGDFWSAIDRGRLQVPAGSGSPSGPGPGPGPSVGRTPVEPSA